MIHLATFPNDVPVYIDAGKTLVRAIDVGRMLGLTPRKTRKWLAQHVHGVSMCKVPCGRGSQMTVTLGREAVVALNRRYSHEDDLLVIVLQGLMGMYDRGFADGRASTVEAVG
jgi:hypothetical protein